MLVGYSQSFIIRKIGYICNDEEYNRIRYYIIENPDNWKEDGIFGNILYKINYFWHTRNRSIQLNRKSYEKASQSKVVAIRPRCYDVFNVCNGTENRGGTNIETSKNHRVYRQGDDRQRDRVFGKKGRKYYQDNRNDPLPCRSVGSG
jgi:hypothetical protein